MQIPLSKPSIDNAEIRVVKQVLQSGWLTDGPKNIEFQEAFARYIGVKKAITFNSATSALYIAVKALGITGEVILPSFTFVASANAVVTAGATPVFADIDFDTCNINPEDIRKKITARTQAVMAVHYAGQSCDMQPIMELVKKHKLYLIEDSAETLGGTYRGKQCGSFGIGCFSFFPTKNITTGEGGMLTTDNEELANNIEALIAHGIRKSSFVRQGGKMPWYRDACFAGYNFRMSNILAAIGVEQLKKIDRMNNLRREHAAYLNKQLRFDEIILPVEKEPCRHVYQMYTVKTRGIERDAFVLGLRKLGVMASVHFTPPVHLQEFYRRNYSLAKDDLSVTESVSSSTVTLPMYPQLKRRELKYMVGAVEKVLRDTRRG